MLSVSQQMWVTTPLAEVGQCFIPSIFILDVMNDPKSKVKEMNKRVRSPHKSKGW
jgi:hypothetical protein